MINFEDMGIALGSLETEDQESFASIKEAPRRSSTRGRWRGGGGSPRMLQMTRC